MRQAVHAVAAASGRIGPVALGRDHDPRGNLRGLLFALRRRPTAGLRTAAVRRRCHRMRETRLEKAGIRRLMRTDDAGTVVLDDAGKVAAEHGTDMHETLLAEFMDDGWRVAADVDRAPPGGPARPPGAVAGDSGAPGLKATENDPVSG